MGEIRTVWVGRSAIGFGSASSDSEIIGRCLYIMREVGGWGRKCVGVGGSSARAARQSEDMWLCVMGSLKHGPYQVHHSPGGYSPEVGVQQQQQTQRGGVGGSLEAHQDGSQHRFQAAPWLIPLESKNTTRRISLQAYRQGKRREENRRLSLNNSEDKAAFCGVSQARGTNRTVNEQSRSTAQVTGCPYIACVWLFAPPKRRPA